MRTPAAIANVVVSRPEAAIPVGATMISADRDCELVGLVPHIAVIASVPAGVPMGTSSGDENSPWASASSSCRSSNVGLSISPMSARISTWAPGTHPEPDSVTVSPGATLVLSTVRSPAVCAPAAALARGESAKAPPTTNVRSKLMDSSQARSSWHEIGPNVPAPESIAVDHTEDASISTVSVRITWTLPADVQQIDDTGLVWSFLDQADEPERVQPGALIVSNRWPNWTRPTPSDLGLAGGRDRRRSGDLPLFRRTLCRLSYPTIAHARALLG